MSSCRPALATALGALLLSPPAAAADGWRQLRLDHAEASSFLRSNWNKFEENYHPNYVGDDNPATAWVEGAEGQGAGEQLVLPVSTLSSARAVKLRIRNGYQKSEALLRANSAPRELKVEVLLGPEVVATTTRSLAAAMGWQELEVALPERAGLSAVRLTVLSTHPGTRYADTCISDVEVWADSSVPPSAPMEAARQQKLDAWITERVAAAAWFASQPVELPFASTSYTSTTTHTTPEEGAVAADIAAARAELDAAEAAGKLHRRTSKRHLPHLPDGMHRFDDMQDLFLAGAVAWFETDDRLATHSEMPDEGDGLWERSHATNDRVTWQDAARTLPATVVWSSLIEGDGRGAYHLTTRTLVRFDASGRPVSVLRLRGEKRDTEDSTVVERYSLHWADGKVQTVRVTRNRDQERFSKASLHSYSEEYRPSP